MNSDYPFQATLGRTHEVFALCFLQRPPSDVIRQGALDCQRHTPGLRTCRPPLISFLQWRGYRQL